jgi:hypothetical protein
MTKNITPTAVIATLTTLLVLAVLILHLCGLPVELAIYPTLGGALLLAAAPAAALAAWRHRLFLLTAFANAVAYLTVLAPYHACCGIYHAARWLRRTAAPAAYSWILETALPTVGAALLVAACWCWDRVSWVSREGHDTPKACRRLWAWGKNNTVTAAQTTAEVACGLAGAVAVFAVLCWENG